MENADVDALATSKFASIVAIQPYLSSEEIRLMAAIGFMSAKAGCLVPAVRIFEALAVLRPGHSFPYIGMAIAYMAIGMASEAVYVLRDRAIPACGENHDLGLWLGLALQQAGNRIAAQTALNASLRELPSDELPSLARFLSILLGNRTDSPKWPTPAPVAELDGETSQE